MRLQARVFRAHNPRWSFAPASGDGAARHGGRFNPVGTPALYTSARLETAWLEAQQGLPFKPQPLTLCAYEVDCDSVLDLTDAGVRGEHDVSGADLACPWEDMVDRGQTPPSWRLASSGGAHRAERVGDHRAEFRARRNDGRPEYRLLEVVR